MAEGMSVTGFIEHDAAGRPFMGLILTGEGCSFKFFLARKDRARMVSNTIGASLDQLAKELLETPDKIMAIQEVPGGLRASKGRKS